MNALGLRPVTGLVYGIGHHGHFVRITRSGGVRISATRTACRATTSCWPPPARVVARGGGPAGRPAVDHRRHPSRQGVLSVTRWCGCDPRPTAWTTSPSTGRRAALRRQLHAHGPRRGQRRPGQRRRAHRGHAGRSAARLQLRGRGDSTRRARCTSSNNNDGHRSRLFAIPHGGPAPELTSAPPVGTSDAARLPRMRRPPPPPPPRRLRRRPPHHAPGSAPRAEVRRPRRRHPSPAPVVVPPPPPSQRR